MSPSEPYRPFSNGGGPGAAHSVHAESTGSDASGDGPRKPVVWTPEDAANFLSAAIKEAQAPLARELRARGVPYSVFVLVFALVALMLLLVLGGMFYLYQQEREDLRQDRKGMELQVTRERKDLAQQIKAELEKNSTLLNQTTALQAQLNESRQQLLETRDALHERNLALTEARAMIERAEHLAEELDQVYSEMNRLEAERNELARLVEIRTAELEEIHGRYEGREREFTQLRKRLRLMQVQSDGVVDEKEALARQLEAAREMLRILQEEGDLGGAIESGPAPRRYDEPEPERARDDAGESRGLEILPGEREPDWRDHGDIPSREDKNPAHDI